MTDAAAVAQEKPDEYGLLRAEHDEIARDFWRRFHGKQYHEKLGGCRFEDMNEAERLDAVQKWRAKQAKETDELAIEQRLEQKLRPYVSHSWLKGLLERLMGAIAAENRARQDEHSRNWDSITELQEKLERMSRTTSVAAIEKLEARIAALEQRKDLAGEPLATIERRLSRQGEHLASLETKVKALQR